ncbi:MAG: TfoX/Sxy family protein [Oscillospiraceae bacterium]|nr:TfoX/Sxy family protein [Oscillospiraceae bacterium]
MATRKEYVTYILEQLSGLEDVRSRAMMGEYLLYYKDRLFSGIYDDRFLVKPVSAAVRLMPDARWELPYSGAKEMLLVEQTDDRAFLETLLSAMYSELPEPKKKKKKA